MIYVEEKGFEGQIKILNLFSRSGLYDIVFWLYPEIKNNKFCELQIYDGQDLSEIPITTYQQGVKTKRTKRFPFRSSCIDFISHYRSTIQKECDSCILYKKDKKEWFCCTIGHEGMCIINDDNLINELKQKKIPASLQAPDWW